MSELERGTIQFENGSKKEIPAPPVAMLDIIIMQLEGAITTTQAPVYVREACANFVSALKKWGSEGKN